MKDTTKVKHSEPLPFLRRVVTYRRMSEWSYRSRNDSKTVVSPKHTEAMIMAHETWTSLHNLKKFQQQIGVVSLLDKLMVCSSTEIWPAL